MSFEKARDLMKENRFLEALREYEAAANESPQHAQILQNKKIHIQLLKKNKQQEKALKECEKTIKNAVGFEKVSLIRFKKDYLRENKNPYMQQLRQGMEICKKLGSKQELAECYYTEAQMFISVSQYHKALASCKKALQQKEKGKYYYLIGQSYENLQDYTEAFSNYLKAYKFLLNEGYDLTACIQKLGKTSIKDNCFEQGHKIINKALSGLKNPKPVKLLQLKVIMLMKLNYDERAVDEVQDIVSLQQKTKQNYRVNHYIHRAILYNKKQKYQQAYNDLQACMRKLNSNILVYRPFELVNLKNIMNQFNRLNKLKIFLDNFSAQRYQKQIKHQKSLLIKEILQFIIENYNKNRVNFLYLQKNKETLNILSDHHNKKTQTILSNMEEFIQKRQQNIQIRNSTFFLMNEDSDFILLQNQSEMSSILKNIHIFPIQRYNINENSINIITGHFGGKHHFWYRISKQILQNNKYSMLRSTENSSKEQQVLKYFYFLTFNMLFLLSQFPITSRYSLELYFNLLSPIVQEIGLTKGQVKKSQVKKIINEIFQIIFRVYKVHGKRNIHQHPSQERKKYNWVDFFKKTKRNSIRLMDNTRQYKFLIIKNQDKGNISQREKVQRRLKLYKIKNIDMNEEIVEGFPTFQNIAFFLLFLDEETSRVNDYDKIEEKFSDYKNEILTSAAFDEIGKSSMCSCDCVVM